MQQTKRDMLLAVVFFIFGTSLYFVIPFFAPGKAGTMLDSRFFPRAVAIAIMGISLLLFVNQLLKYQQETRQILRTEEQSQQNNKFDWSNEKRSVILFIIILAYALMLKPFGYIISTLIATTGILVLLKVKKKSSYVIVYIVSVVIFVLFKYVLFVRLP